MKMKESLTQEEKDFILFLRNQESGKFRDKYYNYTHEDFPKPRNKKEENPLNGRFFSIEKPPIRDCFTNGWRIDKKHYFNLNIAGMILANILVDNNHEEN